MNVHRNQDFEMASVNCLPRGRHSEAAHEKKAPLCPKNVPGVGVGWGWVMKGWGWGWIMKGVGVGWGVSYRGWGWGWVMKGWGRVGVCPYRGGVGQNSNSKK